MRKGGEHYNHLSSCDEFDLLSHFIDNDEVEKA